MPLFTEVFADVEAVCTLSPADAADQIQAALDACAGRIVSGLYGSAESIPRVIADDERFGSYPFMFCSTKGPQLNSPAGFNRLTTRAVQWKLDVIVDGVQVDLLCRVGPNGELELGGDMSNFDGMVPPDWFVRRWNEDNWRFVMFGDQMPYLTLAQANACDQSGVGFDKWLYTYWNSPGSTYYTGDDFATQMRRALDACGVPQAAAPEPEPAPEPAPAPQPEPTPAAPPAPAPTQGDVPMADAQEIKGSDNIALFDRVAGTANIGNLGEDGSGRHAYVVSPGNIGATLDQLVPAGMKALLVVEDAGSFEGVVPA